MINGINAACHFSDRGFYDAALISAPPEFAADVNLTSFFLRTGEAISYSTKCEVLAAKVKLLYCFRGIDRIIQSDSNCREFWKYEFTTLETLEGVYPPSNPGSASASAS